MAPILSELFLNRQSDERLVALARRGHSQAFVAIVSRYQDELLTFVRRTGAEARAEDVVQQALLNAFVALRAGTEVTHLRGWLYAIVRRTLARPAPATPVAGSDCDPAATEPLEDLVLARARARATLEAVSALPRRQRQALLATVFQGHSRAAIAGMLGQSEGSVRQLVHRARTNVRNAVGGVMPYPLARWLPALRDGAAAGDLGTSAMAAPSGGLMAKVGVVLASGLVVTGIAVAPDRHLARGQSRISPLPHTLGAPERRAAVSAPIRAGRPLVGTVTEAVAVTRPATAVARRAIVPTSYSGAQTRAATSQGHGRQQSQRQPVVRKRAPQRASSGGGSDGSGAAGSSPGGSSSSGAAPAPAPVTVDTASAATDGREGSSSASSSDGSSGGSSGTSGSSDGGSSGTGSVGSTTTSDG